MAFLVATLFGISPVFASTTPSAAPATPSGALVIGHLQFEAVYADVTGADLCTPSGGGFSTAPGMSPETSGPPEGAQPT